MHSTGGSPRLNVDEIRIHAKGRWREILGGLGLDLPATATKHGPCPACGGKDRFRFDDKDGSGSWYCNQCKPKAGDGFALIQKVFSCDFPHALETVAREIGYRPLNGHHYRQLTESSDDLAPSMPKGELGRDLFGYENAEGVPVICVKRIDLPNGEKTFRQCGWTVDGRGWQRNLHHAPKPRPLYRLRAILSSVQRLTVFHEGEKATEAALKAGLPGVHTTTLGGAKNPKHTDFNPMKGRDVVICRDNDTDGEYYAKEVARLCQEAGATSVKVLLFPGLPPKGDVVEWLEAGGTPEQFAALIEQAEPLKAACQVPDRGSVSAPLRSHEGGGSLDGATILDAVYSYLGRFVAYPSQHAQVAHTLWIAHTHLMEKWDSTPRLAFLSVEPGSGKTRALEVTEPTVPRAVEAVNATPAYLIRKISSPDGLPTILFDEIDTVFGPKAKENEELRGVLNAGHRRGAVAGRCVIRGKTVETEELPSFCAVAVAGLGNLPDTILTRSVVIKMRKRAPGEKVKPWRRKIHAQEGRQLHDRLAAWAQAIVPFVPENPTMPEGISDRPADVWEALLAVAEAAGGDWPSRARVSCVSLVSHSGDEEASLGVTLLSDIRAILGTREAMFTDDLLAALIARDEAPWGDLRGKPLNARGLANLLKGYGIKSKQVRCRSVTAKGYSRESFHDAFTRYLPPLANPMSAGSETRETSETSHSESGEQCFTELEQRPDVSTTPQPREVFLYVD